MTAATLKATFEAATQQGVVMSLGPGGQVTMMGPRDASRALNAAIRGNEDLFVTLLCEYLGRATRDSFADEVDLDDMPPPSAEAKRQAWHAASACFN